MAKNVLKQLLFAQNIALNISFFIFFSAFIYIFDIYLKNCASYEIKFFNLSKFEKTYVNHLFFSFYFFKYSFILVFLNSNCLILKRNFGKKRKYSKQRQIYSVVRYRIIIYLNLLLPILADCGVPHQQWITVRNVHLALPLTNELFSNKCMSNSDFV